MKGNFHQDTCKLFYHMHGSYKGNLESYKKQEKNYVIQFDNIEDKDYMYANGP